MLHTEVQGNQFVGSGEEDFSIYGKGGHVGYVIWIS